MSVYVNENGDLVIKLSDAAAAEKLTELRKALMALVAERSEDFIYKEPVDTVMDFLIDTEPDTKIWSKAFER